MPSALGLLRKTCNGLNKRIACISLTRFVPFSMMIYN